MADPQVDEFAEFAQISGSADTGKPDEFSQFQSASPTFSEKAGTFAQGGVRGAVTMTGTTAGLLSGVAARRPCWSRWHGCWRTCWRWSRLFCW